MNNLHPVAEKFNELGVCVIIPTYNNQGTLAQVISDVLHYTTQVIVVNDGSTDETANIIASFPQIQSVSYADNVGKGWALRQAFKYAIEKGYQYAITIDSDGQHFAKDIPAFIDKLETERDAIIIGSRNMEQASIPGKSSFGHKFSNFWYWVETGVRCPDTQSGFRLYPIYQFKKSKFYTIKYEFEIEVLVRAAWSGVKIDSVPVTVYYAPKATRVSHFRPFQDFSRVSLLNTVLVIITFLCIKPRDFFRVLFNFKKLKQAIKDQLFNPSHTANRKAASVAVGVFTGILPIWGFQTVAALGLALLFRLNKVLALIFVHVSLPPLIPIVIFLSYKIGGLWMSDNYVEMALADVSLKSIGEHLTQYIFGSVTLAVIAGLAAWLITLALLTAIKKKPVSQA